MDNNVFIPTQSPAIEFEMHGVPPRDDIGKVQEISHYHIAREWEPPRDRFIEYEPSDEPWLRYCRIGSEVDVTYTWTAKGYISKVDFDSTKDTITSNVSFVPVSAPTMTRTVP